MTGGVFVELKSGLPDFRPDFATKTPYYWDFLEMILYVEREKNMIDRPDYYYYYRTRLFWVRQYISSYYHFTFRVVC